jgi:hypothetical protein
LLSYERLSKKPLLLFKSFTVGLTIKEFDDIYDKRIIRYRLVPIELDISGNEYL